MSYDSDDASESGVSIMFNAEPFSKSEYGIIFPQVWHLFHRILLLTFLVVAFIGC